jgi:hypothetical protein
MAFKESLDDFSETLSGADVETNALPGMFSAWVGF